MNKTVAKQQFRDSSIEAIKIPNLEFSYINKEGVTKYRRRLWIPFDVAKKSALKGLALCIHKSTKNKYFTLHYWFNKKSKLLTIGKFVPGVFGTKQCEEKLFELVKEHTNEKGIWIRDPAITVRDIAKTRVRSIIMTL